MATQMLVYCGVCLIHCLSYYSAEAEGVYQLQNNKYKNTEGFLSPKFISQAKEIFKKTHNVDLIRRLYNINRYKNATGPELNYRTTYVQSRQRPNLHSGPKNFFYKCPKSTPRPLSHPHNEEHIPSTEELVGADDKVYLLILVPTEEDKKSEEGPEPVLGHLAKVDHNAGGNIIESCAGNLSKALNVSVDLAEKILEADEMKLLALPVRGVNSLPDVIAKLSTALKHDVSYIGHVRPKISCLVGNKTVLVESYPATTTQEPENRKILEQIPAKTLITIPNEPEEPSTTVGPSEAPTDKKPEKQTPLENAIVDQDLKELPTTNEENDITEKWKRMRIQRLENEAKQKISLLRKSGANWLSAMRQSHNLPKPRRAFYPQNSNLLV